MLKFIVLAMVLGFACACGGGGGSSTPTTTTQNPTFPIAKSDLNNLGESSWFSISYVLNDKEEMPTNIRKCNLAISSTGNWTAIATGSNVAYGFGINSFIFNSLNDYDSYMKISEFSYSLTSINNLTINQKYTDIDGSHKLSMRMIRSGIEEGFSGNYIIDSSSYLQNGVNFSAYGFKSGSFFVDEKGNNTVTLIKTNGVPVSTSSQLTIRTRTANEYDIYELYGNECGLGTLVKTGIQIQLLMRYSDGNVTSLTAYKQ